MSKDKPSYKDKNGTTRVGDFLRGLKKNILPGVLDAVGVGDLAKAVGIISNDPNNGGLTKSEVEEFIKLAELDIQNTADARSMQKIALGQTDVFSKRFVYYLASFWSIFSAVYVVSTTFIEVKNERVADTVLGFLLGTLVATIINYFYGSNQSSKDHNDASVLKKLTKN